MRKTCVDQILGLLFVLWVTGLSGGTSESHKDVEDEKQVSNSLPPGITGRATFDSPSSHLLPKSHVPNSNGQREMSNKGKHRKDPALRMKSCALRLPKMTTHVCPIVRNLGKINRLLSERRVLQELLNGTIIKQKSSSEINSFLSYVVKRIELGNLKLKIDIDNKQAGKGNGTELEKGKEKALKEDELSLTRRSGVMNKNDQTTLTPEKIQQITIGLDVVADLDSNMNNTGSLQ